MMGEYDNHDTYDKKGYAPHDKSFENAYFTLPNNQGFLDLRAGIKITQQPEISYTYDINNKFLLAVTPTATYSVTPEILTRRANTDNIMGRKLKFKLGSGGNFILINENNEICHYYFAKERNRPVINAFFSEYDKYGQSYKELEFKIMRKS